MFQFMLLDNQNILLDLKRSNPSICRLLLTSKDRLIQFIQKEGSENYHGNFNSYINMIDNIMLTS
jgi:hypothetical protein